MSSVALSALRKITGVAAELRVGFQPLAYLVTIHFRHIDIQQKQIRGILDSGRQGQSPPRKRTYLVTMHFQHVFQELQVGGLIVHHHDVGMFNGCH